VLNAVGGLVDTVGIQLRVQQSVVGALDGKGAAEDVKLSDNQSKQ